MVKFFSASALVLVTMAFMMACSDVPTTPTNDGASSRDGEISAKPGGGGGSANPAFVFPSTRRVSNFSNRSTVAVSDVDGSDVTAVYTCSTVGPRIWYPTWSPSGAQVSFVEMPATQSGGSWYESASWGTYSVKVVDVNVTNGVVSGSNVRTVFTALPSESLRVISQDWCPATSGPGAGKIAFMALGVSVSRIYLVPASGGPATVLYEVNNQDYRIRGGSLTWSPDGTQLAFTQYSGTNTSDADSRFAIKIIDLNGTVVSTVLDGSINIAQVRWSPTDIGTLACLMSPNTPFSTTTNTYSIYKVGTTSTSTQSLVTPVRLSTHGSSIPAWSPDGAEMIFINMSEQTTRINMSSLATTTVGTNVKIGDWK